eukprot:3940528-Rhodomonas_salina.1
MHTSVVPGKSRRRPQRSNPSSTTARDRTFPATPCAIAWYQQRTRHYHTMCTPGQHRVQSPEQGLGGQYRTRDAVVAELRSVPDIVQWAVGQYQEMVAAYRTPHSECGQNCVVPGSDLGGP